MPTCSAVANQFIEEETHRSEVLNGDIVHLAPDPKRNKVLFFAINDLAPSITEFLESSNFEVTTVQNASQGLIKILKESFDVVLCDTTAQEFPADTLYFSVKRLRQEQCSRFLFLADESQAPQKMFIRHVKGRVLWKPFTVEDLRIAIGDLLASYSISVQSR